MSSPLTWTPIEGGLAVAGRIDEHAELSQLAAALPEGPTRLDLGGLTRINSIGVREWMDFISTVRQTLVLVRCSPAFVDQMNAIANFAGAAAIGSVLAAYECERDGAVTHVEVGTKDARAGKRPTAPACETCGSTMVAAVDDELYYRFLRYTK